MTRKLNYTNPTRDTIIDWRVAENIYRAPSMGVYGSTVLNPHEKSKPSNSEQGVGIDELKTRAGEIGDRYRNKVGKDARAHCSTLISAGYTWDDLASWVAKDEVKLLCRLNASIVPSRLRKKYLKPSQKVCEAAR